MRAVRALERWAAGLSFAAAAVHLMAGPGHVAEWWAYGLFFFGAAAVQAAYGLLLATRGIEGWGGWLAVRRRVYCTGIVLTVAVVAVWIVSRTVGVPVGPAAFEPEPLGFLDVTSKVMEVSLLAVLGRLLAVTPRRSPTDEQG